MTKASPIIIGSDHAGFELKERVKKLLSAMNIEFKDVGAFSESTSDYPVYISEVAAAISNGEYSRGIAIDGIGVGASIVANRFPRVRAALCTNSDMARLARAHNDSNVLVLGGWMTSSWHAENILSQWLTTKFEGGRHAKRLSLIDDNTRLRIAMHHLDSIEAPEKLDDQLYHTVTKGIERLTQLFRPDRRDDDEARLPESCPAKFTFKGTRFSALMVDLSKTGAQFKLVSSKKLDLKPSDSIEYEIRTPYGTSKCTGQVIWVDRQFYLTWGVKFTKLSNDKNDPLMSLMDSM